jgi:hypothetical protein
MHSNVLKIKWLIKIVAFVLKYPEGQQCKWSLQQTALGIGQQPYSPLLNWQQVVPDGHCAPPPGQTTSNLVFFFIPGCFFFQSIDLNMPDVSLFLSHLPSAGLLLIKIRLFIS